jgi:hypothetical protein
VFIIKSGKDIARKKLGNKFSEFQVWTSDVSFILNTRLQSTSFTLNTQITTLGKDLKDVSSELNVKIAILTTTMSDQIA